MSKCFCTLEIDVEIRNFLQLHLCLENRTTDLKIDWIWHILLKIEAGVIGPTLFYFGIQNHVFPRFYSFYTILVNINGIKTRKM